MKTIEEKAKAYDEALERAKKAIIDCGDNEGRKRMIYGILPEMNPESEDEKAKKIIASVFSKAGNRYIQESERDIVLAYLEKQKEQKPITESKRLANEVIEYLTKCGYSPVLKDDSKKEHFHIDIPRHEDDFWQSEEYKHCSSVLGEYYMEGDYGSDTYTLYIRREKKEQKPVDEFPPLEGLDAIKAKYYENGFKNGFDEGVNSIKPAEWREEDERKYYQLEYSMKAAGSIPAHLIQWALKSLRRPSWKPSKEQIAALKWQVEHPELVKWRKSDLESLLEQLKKLM